MLRFVTDEHVPRALVRAVSTLEPTLDIVRNVEVGLLGADDHALLDWAAAEGRVVLSADRQTLIGFANQRIATGRPFAGPVAYRDASIGQLADDLLTVAGVYDDEDVRAVVVYIPL